MQNKTKQSFWNNMSKNLVGRSQFDMTGSNLSNSSLPLGGITANKKHALKFQKGIAGA